MPGNAWCGLFVPGEPDRQGGNCDPGYCREFHIDQVWSVALAVPMFCETAIGTSRRGAPSYKLDAHAVDFSPAHCAGQQPLVRKLQVEGVGRGQRVFDLDHGAGIGQVSDEAIKDRVAVVKYDFRAEKRSLSSGHSAFG